MPKTKAARRGVARMTAKVEKRETFRVGSRYEFVALNKILLELLACIP